MRSQAERELVARCFFEHPLLSFDPEDMRDLARVLTRTTNPDSRLEGVYACKQRDLAGQAFARATGWQLPAQVEVTGHEGRPYAMLLMEVYLEDCEAAGLQWCAAGYRLGTHGSPQDHWQEVPLNWVRPTPVAPALTKWFARARLRARLWLKTRLKSWRKLVPAAGGTAPVAFTFISDEHEEASIRPSRWLPL
jgi:hypothetical protein